jgi:type IV pilus assembly protein PilX
MLKEKRNQSGISLFIVMMIVLLTAIVVAMGFKSSQFNEISTGNSAEYQRVYEAAQAVLHDAELDIMNKSATGACTISCRKYGEITDADSAAGGKMYFPLPDTLEEVRAELYYNKSSGGTGCIAGICYPLLKGNEPYAFWNEPSEIALLKRRAAKYGQFTQGIGGVSGKSNPRLQNSWYWVELLPYDPSSAFQGGTSLAPTDMNVIYRITALVEGTRNTRSVIQKLVVGKKNASSN